MSLTATCHGVDIFCANKNQFKNLDSLKLYKNLFSLTWGVYCTRRFRSFSLLQGDFRKINAHRLMYSMLFHGGIVLI